MPAKRKSSSKPESSNSTATIESMNSEGGMMKTKEMLQYEGIERPQGSRQVFCAANHPPAGQTVAPLRNIRRDELPLSPSRTEQSRVYRKMRRLAAGVERAERSETDWLTSQPAGEARRRGSIRVLARAARRWGNCASGQAATASRGVRRTHRHLRHDHQTSERQRLTAFLPSSFILQTSPASPASSSTARRFRSASGSLEKVNPVANVAPLPNSDSP